MRKIVVTISICILLVGCNNNSKVIEKSYYPAQISRLMYIEKGEIKYTTEMHEEEYTVLTIDDLEQKVRHTVSEDYYNKLKVGDVFEER